MFMVWKEVRWNDDGGVETAQSDDLREIDSAWESSVRHEVSNLEMILDIKSCIDRYVSRPINLTKFNRKIGICKPRGDAVLKSTNLSIGSGVMAEEVSLHKMDHPFSRSGDRDGFDADWVEVADWVE